jgi:four helix bundle protein
MKTEFEGRTKEFAVQIVKLIRTFPKTVDGIEVGRQLLKSGTSIGANYREANRAESKGDFIHKIGIAEKEASETVYWLEICNTVILGTSEQTRSLLAEANELLAILTTIGRKAKGRTSRLAGTLPAIAMLVFPLFRLPLSAFLILFSLSAFPLSAFHITQ